MIASPSVSHSDAIDGSSSIYFSTTAQIFLVILTGICESYRAGVPSSCFHFAVFCDIYRRFDNYSDTEFLILINMFSGCCMSLRMYFTSNERKTEV